MEIPRPTRKHYTHAIANALKARRKREAEERQKERDERSDDEQLLLIEQRRGLSEREALRLKKGAKE